MYRRRRRHPNYIILEQLPTPTGSANINDVTRSCPKMSVQIVYVICRVFRQLFLERSVFCSLTFKFTKSKIYAPGEGG